MRVGLLSLALIIAVFASGLGNLASATPIAFAQTSQPRNQAQSQEGLPPEKKKALAGYGPEDVFGQSSERENNNNRASSRQRRPSPTSGTTSAPTPSAPTPRQPAISAPTPSATPLQPSEETPSPTVAAGSLDNGGQSPSLGQGASANIISGWKAPAGLLALALVVLTALIFTLTKLVEKIRESSSG
jgi:cytoskeletal protein RodZ